MNEGTCRSFADCVDAADDELNLAEAALCFAREQAYPDLVPDQYLSRLDHLAEGAKAAMPEGATVEERVLALNHHLFETESFRGNSEEYYDPRNSYLNEVLDRRTGIPISLSTIYLETGRRVGLPLEGVSFPSHFLVKMPFGDGILVLDPFHGGIPLAEDDLRDLLVKQLGKDPPLDLSSYIEGVDGRSIILRMLRNLKYIHLSEQAYEPLLKVQNHILTLVGDDPEELRDRGVVLAELDCPRAAVSDLRRYLALRPRTSDAKRVRMLIVRLEAKKGTLN